MSFGGSSTTPPAPQPQIPVPQSDDPRSLEAQRKAVIAAKANTGSASAHLLTGEGGLASKPGVKPKKLIGQTYSVG